MSQHVEVRGTTMEPDPANPALMRQTAYCRFCAQHRPDEDPRWPCETARYEAALDDVWSYSRSAITMYCNWCGARPEQSHAEGCAASIARRALGKRP